MPWPSPREGTRFSWCGIPGEAGANRWRFRSRMAICTGRGWRWTAKGGCGCSGRRTRAGNFDLYARAFKGGQGGEVIRLTTDHGADITPVAATDAQGRVWVAWQAFRGGRSEIHAARQEGSGYSTEMVVGSSASNEWDPAIAASRTGEVAIAWDSYRKGDYDVYLRTYDARGGRERSRTVAATRSYEAYPSLAYDPSGRLWVGWEESDEGWGKDWGSYDTGGIALYQGRWIRLKVFQDGQAYEGGDIGAVLPGVPNARVDSTARQGDLHYGFQPDARLVKMRLPNGGGTEGPVPPPRPLNTMPRLLAESRWTSVVSLPYPTACVVVEGGRGVV